MEETTKQPANIPSGTPIQQQPNIPTPSQPSPDLEHGGRIPPPQPPSQETAPKKSNPIGRIIVAIIIVSVLTAAIMFAIQRMTPSAKKTTQETNSKSAMPTESIETTKQSPAQTEGWGTYTNEDNTFSINYPSNLQLKEMSPGMGVNSVEFRSSNNLDSKYMADYQLLVMPKLLAKTIGQDFDDYHKMKDNTSKTISGQDVSRQLTKVNNRTIDDLRAFNFRSTGSPPVEGEEATIGVYLEIGNSIMIISTLERNKATLEQMLDTFKEGN